MEFPYGHHSHHQRDNDEERQNYPPPGTNLSSFDQHPPSPNPYYREDQPPPNSYYREDQPYPPPNSYHGEDQPHPTTPNTYYGADRPSPATQVSHVSHVGPPSSLGGGFFNQQPPPPPPPNSYYGEDRPSPPTQVSHVSHSFHGHAAPPPSSQGEGFFNQPPPPPVHNLHYQSEEAVNVQHVSHQVHYNESHHQQQSSPAPFGTHHIHHTSHLNSSHHPHHSDYFSNKPTYRVFAKGEPNFYLTVREGQAILARSHPSDDSQHWYKDEKYSTRVKDEERFPSFSLINKATGLALKHSIGATHPVQLISYNPDVLDESVLWTESADLGDGFRTVRMVNNIHLNLDAFHGDKKSGGIHDGTTIVTWYKNKQDNQRWKIVPY